MQQQIIDKKLRFFVIDASRVAREVGLGARINTILQTCFFAISGVLPRDEAIAQIKQSIEKTYGRKGARSCEKNIAAVDDTLARLYEVAVPGTRHQPTRAPPLVPDRAPELRPRRDRDDVRGPAATTSRSA